MGVRCCDQRHPLTILGVSKGCPQEWKDHVSVRHPNNLLLYLREILANHNFEEHVQGEPLCLSSSSCDFGPYHDKNAK